MSVCLKQTHLTATKEKNRHSDIVCSSLAHSLALCLYFSVRMCRHEFVCLYVFAHIRDRTMNKYHLITRDMICKAENMYTRFILFCLIFVVLASNDWNHRDAKVCISRFRHILVGCRCSCCYCHSF